MHASPRFGSRSLLVRHRYDPREQRITLVADVGSTPADDLRVLASPRSVHLVVEDEHGVTTRSIRPPSDDHRFTDDRRAVLQNGVLEVAVGVDRTG